MKTLMVIMVIESCRYIGSCVLDICVDNLVSLAELTNSRLEKYLGECLYSVVDLLISMLLNMFRWLEV